MSFYISSLPIYFGSNTDRQEKANIGKMGPSNTIMKVDSNANPFFFYRFYLFIASPYPWISESHLKSNHLALTAHKSPGQLIQIVCCAARTVS